MSLNKLSISAIKRCLLFCEVDVIKSLLLLPGVTNGTKELLASTFVVVVLIKI
jgi:hypothetical protein